MEESSLMASLALSPHEVSSLPTAGKDQTAPRGNDAGCGNGSGQASRTLHRWGARLAAFAELTEKWRGVHLKSLQQDDTYTQILLNHEELQSSRKIVSAQTKQFSQLDNETKLNEMGNLLKLYQGHIDHIMRHLKFVERGYIALFDGIRGIVDPYPMMDKFSRERDSILVFIREAEAKDALHEEVRVLHAELKDLRNQEVTIQQLRRQVAEAEISSMRHAAESAHDAHADYQAVLSHWQQREHDMQRELSVMRHENVKKSLEIKDANAALLQLRVRLEESAAQHEKQLDQLVEELEAAQVALVKKDTALRLASELRETAGTLAESAKPASGAREGLTAASGVDSSPATHAHAANVTEESRTATEEPITRRKLLQELDAEQQSAEEAQQVLIHELEQRLRKSEASATELRGKIAELQREKLAIDESHRGLQVECGRLREFAHSQRDRMEHLQHAVQDLEKENMSLTKQIEAAGLGEAAASVSLFPGAVTLKGGSVVESGCAGTAMQCQEKLLSGSGRTRLGPELAQGEGTDGFCFDALIEKTAEDMTARRATVADSTGTAAAASTNKRSDPDPGKEVSGAVAHVTHPMEIDEAGKDPFLVVAAQRDKLRQRLLTLEEVSSSQTHSLRMEIIALTNENKRLREQLGRDTAAHLASYGPLGQAASAPNSVAVSIGGDRGGSSLSDKSSFLPSLRLVGSSVLSRKSVLQILDYVAGVLSLVVLSSMSGRRLFIVYLAGLHVYVSQRMLVYLMM